MSILNYKGKTPWVNEGLVGFFEYETEIYDFHLVARTKEELQKEITHLLINLNYDMVSNYIKENTPTEYYEEFSEEQKESTSFAELLHQRLNDEEYRDEIYNKLVKEGIIVYPTNTKIDEVEFKCHIINDEEINEISYFLKNFPNTSQEELEDIYLIQNSENTKYLLHRKIVDDAEVSAQNYESNLEVSELLCQIYEEKLAIEEQLISNSEMIVDLYEKVNITE